MGTANIGIDCQVILDGVGYWIEPHSYRMHRPRIRKAVVTKGGSERYVDVGPGKRVWAFVVLGLSGLKRYDGQALNLTGEQVRDALVASYSKSGVTLSFTDPNAAVYTVHFDDYQESVRDLKAQLVAVSYLCTVTLVEA